MNLIRYICNRSQELAAASLKAPLVGGDDAEFQALQLVFEVYRFLAKILFIPWVLINYVRVLVGSLPVPAPALELLQLQKQEQDFQKKTQAAKKVGFQPPTRNPDGFN